MQFNHQHDQPTLQNIHQMSQENALLLKLRQRASPIDQSALRYGQNMMKRDDATKTYTLSLQQN